MLDQNDIKQIGSVIQTELQKTKKELKDELIVAVGEVIEQQVLPQMRDIVKEEIEQQVLPQMRDIVKEEIASLPTKSYLDDKLADLKGDLIVKVKRENEKVDFIVGLLRERGVFTDNDVRRIKQEFQIFPSASV